MSWQRVLRAAAAAAVVAAGALSFAVGAQAGSGDSGSGYPSFAHEGRYPIDTNCSFRQRDRAKLRWRGRTVTLRYYLSSRCGSYARIDNAPRDCEVRLDRTPDDDIDIAWDFVFETVDAGERFAVTRIGNNLNGRKSRGAVICGTRKKRIARTPFRRAGKQDS